MERESSERITNDDEEDDEYYLVSPQVWREETVHGRSFFFFSLTCFPPIHFKNAEMGRLYRWAAGARIGPYEMMDRASSILFLFLIFYYLNAYLIYQVKFKC